MGRIYTIGEVLIDFLPKEKGILKDLSDFEKKFGGAPANVAMIVSKLGGDAAFIGKVGADPFGDFLIAMMEEFGVNTDNVFRTKEAKTTLAFVSLDKNGERDFSFYRDPGADMLLNREEISGVSFKKGDFLCFGSFGLIDAPVLGAIRSAVNKMRDAGGTVLFDPNIREDIWKDRKKLRERIREFIPLADMVKLSQEEILFLSGMKDVRKGIEILRKDIPCMVATLGSEGAELVQKEFTIHRIGEKVKAVDTTGAGDAFVGSLLFRLQQLDKKPGEIGIEEWEGILDFCNKISGKIITVKGAIEALSNNKVF